MKKQRIEEKTDPKTGLAVIPESDTIAAERHRFEIGIPELKIVKSEKIELPISELKISKSTKDAKE